MGVVEVMQKVIGDAERQDELNNVKIKSDLWPDSDDHFPVELAFRFCFCPHPAPSFFQVEILDADKQFVREIDKCEVLWTKQHRYRMEVVVKGQVARIISNHHGSLRIIKEYALVSGDFEFYSRAIKAAATLVRYLYPKEYLYRRGRIVSLRDQLNELWEQFALLGKKACSIHQLCESLILHKIDIHKYSLVTETNLVHMLLRYRHSLVEPHTFKHHFAGPSFPIEENQIYADIKKETRKMTLYPRWQPDEYTTFLIEFVRSDAVNQVEQLLADVMKICESPPKPQPTGPSVEEVKVALEDLLRGLILEIKMSLPSQLSVVIKPMSVLSMLGSVYPSFAVQELIQVAELRRMALGSRFIRRNHFLWAFYKSGYGLPPRIRHMVRLNIIDEDHPPYHIYMTSIKLAQSLDETRVRLEHFLFAVLYANDTCINGKQVIDMRENFKDFMKDVAWDFVKRFNATSAMWMKPNVAWFTEEELEEEFWSCRLGNVVSEYLC